MKYIIIILLFPILSFGQTFDFSKVPTEKVRIIDRHLKTMINMDIELQEFRKQVDQLHLDIAATAEEAKKQLDFIVLLKADVDSLAISEQSAIDTTNYYKMLLYGEQIRVYELNERVSDLTRENWTDKIFKFLVVLSIIIF